MHWRSRWGLEAVTELLFALPHVAWLELSVGQGNLSLTLIFKTKLSRCVHQGRPESSQPCYINDRHVLLDFPPPPRQPSYIRDIEDWVPVPLKKNHFPQVEDVAVMGFCQSFQSVPRSPLLLLSVGGGVSGNTNVNKMWVFPPLGSHNLMAEILICV